MGAKATSRKSTADRVLNSSSCFQLCYLFYMLPLIGIFSTQFHVLSAEHHPSTGPLRATAASGAGHRMYTHAYTRGNHAHSFARTTRTWNTPFFQPDLFAALCFKIRLQDAVPRNFFTLLENLKSNHQEFKWCPSFTSESWRLQESVTSSIVSSSPFGGSGTVFRGIGLPVVL